MDEPAVNEDSYQQWPVHEAQLLISRFFPSLGWHKNEDMPQIKMKSPEGTMPISWTMKVHNEVMIFKKVQRISLEA